MNSNYKIIMLTRKMDLKMNKYCEFLKNSFENNEQLIQALSNKENLLKLLSFKKMLQKQIPNDKEIEEVLAKINNNFKRFAVNNKNNSYGGLNGVQDSILLENEKEMKKLKNLMSENFLSEKYVKTLIQISRLEKNLTNSVTEFLQECKNFEKEILTIKIRLKELNINKPLSYKYNEYYSKKQSLAKAKEETELEA